MGVNIDWDISGKHKDGSELTDSERTDLQDALDGYCENDIEDSGEYLVSFFTEGISDQEGVRNALIDYTSSHAGITIEAEFMYDTAKSPGRMRVWDDRVHIDMSKVVYENDEDEPVTDLFTTMCANLPLMPTENCKFWSDGDEILCEDQAAINAMADLLASAGYEAITGFYDPEEDKRQGEVDNCTGFYYVTI